MSQLHLKLAAAATALTIAVAGCSGHLKADYSIQASKSYEASLFRQNCAICHGPEADGRTLSDGQVVPGLRNGDFKFRTDAEIHKHIAEGGNGMAPFRGLLTERELNLMVDCVQRDLRGNNK